MLTNYEFSAIARLLEWVEGTDLPPTSTGSNGAWTCDEWHQEVLKYMVNGEKYFSLPVPSYFQYDDVQSVRETFKKYGEKKFWSYDAMQTVKDLSDTLIVAEMGRGIDLLLALLVKKWKQVIVYDKNIYYGDLVVGYFKNHYGVDITYVGANTGNIDWRSDDNSIQFIPCDNHPPSYIFSGDCVLSLEDAKLGAASAEKMFSNPNIKAVVKWGKVPKTTEEFFSINW